MATIKDVAKASGYGIATVSYALNDHPKIPENTKKKILEIAKQEPDRVKVVDSKQSIEDIHKQILELVAR